MTLQLAELYLTHLQNQRRVQKFSEDVVAGRKFNIYSFIFISLNDSGMV